MIERVIVPFVFLFFCAQTRIPLDAQASPISDDVDIPVLQAKPVKAQRVNISESVDSNGTKTSRQLEEEDDNNIDVDGPYGYIPRVVGGVRKIVKGLLNGSVHSIFHGAFGMAPEDASDDLIETYNRIFGIVSPDDLPERIFKPKPKPKAKTTTAPEKLTNSTASTDSVGLPTTEKTKKNEKNSKDEEEDDEDLDLDEDDEK